MIIFEALSILWIKKEKCVVGLNTWWSQQDLSGRHSGPALVPDLVTVLVCSSPDHDCGHVVAIPADGRLMYWRGGTVGHSNSHFRHLCVSVSLISKLLHRSLALFYPTSSAVEVDKKRRCYSSALMKRAKLWMNHKGIFLLAPLQSITSFERYTAHKNLKVGPHGLFCVNMTLIIFW